MCLQFEVAKTKFHEFYARNELIHLQKWAEVKRTAIYSLSPFVEHIAYELA